MKDRHHRKYQKKIYPALQGRRESNMIMICEIHWAMFKLEDERLCTESLN